jgi:allophanate hydrolase subunit 2
VNLLSMRTKLLFAGLAAGSMAALSSPAIAQMPPGSDCSFQSLSPEEKSRYQSRYRRRVRSMGKLLPIMAV